MKDDQRVQGPGAAGHLLTGVRWLVFGRLIVMALSLIGTAALSRLLTPLEFGMIAAALAIISFADSLFEGAFGLNLIHAKTVSEQDVATTFWLVLLLSALLAGAVVSLSPFIEHFYSTKGIAITVAASSFAIVARGLGTTPRALMQRSGDFRGLVASNAVAYLFGQFALSIALAYLGFGVWSLVWGGVVTGSIEAGLNLYQSRIRPWRRVSPSGAITFIRHSSPYALSQLLSWASNSVGNIAVGRSLGIASLGVFSRSWRLIDIITSLVSTPLQRVLFPAFAHLRGDPMRAKAIMAGALRVGLPIFGLAAAAAMLHAPAIVRLLLGPSWTEATPIMQLLALGLLPRCAYKITESVAFGVGQSTGTAWRSAIQATLMVGAAWLGSMFSLLHVAGFISIAMWLYYLISVTYASTLLAARAGEILRLHAKAMLPVLVYMLADCLGEALVPNTWFWLGHFVGGSAGLLAVITFLAAAPEALLGPEWSGARAHIKRSAADLLRRLGH